ncbi:unnamed protein product [Sphagnum balticum]
MSLSTMQQVQLPYARSGSLLDHKAAVAAAPPSHGEDGGQREKRWQEFFLDPSQWWDHRPEKGKATKLKLLVKGSFLVIAGTSVLAKHLEQKISVPDLRPCCLERPGQR